MSHFFTVVLVPKDTQNIETKIQELLAPYNENEEVDEYDKDCWCINSEARKAGMDAAELQKGPFDKLRTTFWDKVNAKLSTMGIYSTAANYWDERERVSGEFDWPSHIKEYTDVENEVTTLHPMFNKPSPECEECQGTGLYKSTYNPSSKWDWWVVGGRYDGVIQNNYRSSENGFNFGEQHHQLQHNAIPAKEYLRICRENKGQYPYSILTPNGEWCEKGEMGWFGITSNEKEDWIPAADQILEKYQDCIAIGCDLHI